MNATGSPIINIFLDYGFFITTASLNTAGGQSLVIAGLIRQIIRLRLSLFQWPPTGLDTKVTSIHIGYAVIVIGWLLLGFAASLLPPPYAPPLIVTINIVVRHCLLSPPLSLPPFHYATLRHN